jgi:LacI family transcriptional regulator
VTAQPGPEQVLRRTQSLAGLVRQDITALLCLNDNWAQQCYLWCLAAGLRVPADMSIVSFDNHPDHQMLPLATIDFGFSRLGYLAGRILCGALPSEADRTGDIPGISALVNRGSLGPPNNKTAGRVRAMLH